MSTLSTGRVLSFLMKKFDLNALDVERLTGVPASTTYRLLKNKGGNPTVEVLKKLAGFFHVTVSQLIGEETLHTKQIPLVPSLDVLRFIQVGASEQSMQTIPVDFPLGSRSFATVVQDDLMEPFIACHSIVIVDPEQPLANKDFILTIRKKQPIPQVRQVIKDGGDVYLKVLNPQFSTELTKVSLEKEFQFVGVIVHYRTNLVSLRSSMRVKEPDTLYDKEVL